MITIDCSDIAKAAAMLSRLANSEIRFATAKGLTDIAKACQTKVIEELPQRFTLRNKWFMPNTPLGFKITMARKDNLRSEVYSKASFLVLQEEGGIKRSASGHRIAVPTDSVRRNKKDIITKSQRPSQIKKLFSMKDNGRTWLVKRVTRGDAKGSLQFLYQLRTSTKIKSRLRFYETCRAVVDRDGQRIMSESIQYAIDHPRK